MPDLNTNTRADSGAAEYRVGVYVDVDRETSGLTGLRLPGKIKAIQEMAFMGSAAEAVTIPYGCTEIGSKAFAGSPNLIYVSIPASVTKVADDAFADCPELLYVKLPSSLTNLTEDKFARPDVILERFD